MSLTPEQQRLREGKLTASVVGPLMTGDAEKMLNVWRFMVGDPTFEDRDWQRFWPSRLGEASEALNLEFYEYATGRSLTRRGEVVTHPEHEWAAATLDAFDDGLPGPVDAKHVGGFERREVIVARYTPQMMWQMDCLGCKRSALSIIEGAREPVIEPVEWNADYSAELWRRAEVFIECVRSLTPPVEFAPVVVPVRAVKVIDMTGSNQWAMLAADWRETRIAARSFEAAAKGIKDLVPNDVGRCFGHGIEVVRDKANRLSVKELRA
jgi:hypothetical protein